VLLTVNGLREIGQRAALVAHPDGELRRRASEGLELIPIAPRTEVDLTAAWRFSRVVKKLRPDVVHAHDPHGVAMAALALSFAGGAPAPVLVASRRVDFRLKGNSLSRWKYRRLTASSPRPKRFGRCSWPTAFPRRGPSRSTRGSTSSTPKRRPRVNLHEAFWLPHHAPIVGNVAALVPHKGQRYLVDAAHLVVQQVPDARFVILGEGELREHLERQVRDYRLEKHVLLPGFRTDVLGCIKGFDLFAMSSVTEGLGTSLLDAMACGKPIVATDAGGIPEVVDQGVSGTIVPARDARAMANAIVELLSDESRRRSMGAAGLARVKARFTVERMVAATAKVYARAAGKPHVTDTASPSATG
jgi:glycosyltransferase involved in cell wall biosynthesis